MSLHTDTVNGYTGILHLLHHVKDTVALAGVALVIVVIEQQGVGISLTGKFESLSDELVTTELVVATVAIGAAWCELTIGEVRTNIIGHSLVHHIPAINDVLITVHNSMDVLTQTLVEHFLLDGFTLLVSEHPVSKL